MSHQRVVEGERPIAQVLRDIGAHSEQLVRTEIKLALAEVRDEVIAGARHEVTRVMRRSVVLLAGATLGLFSIMLLLLSVVHALSAVVPAWLAALIVTLALGLAAAALLFVGFKPADPQTETNVEIAIRDEEKSPWAAAQSN